MNAKFSQGQSVRGRVCGHFVVLGYVPGVAGLVEVKEVNPATGAMARGTLRLTEECLVAA